MEKGEFFSLKTEERLALGEKWSEQSLETPTWLAELLTAIQTTYKVRIQTAYDIFERMYTYGVNEEEAYHLLQRELNKRKQQNEQNKK